MLISISIFTSAHTLRTQMADDYYNCGDSAVKRGPVNCIVHGVMEDDEYVTLFTPVEIHDGRGVGVSSEYHSTRGIPNSRGTVRCILHGTGKK